ncbi:hypothetical protein [Kordiimonas laminariae]|uniref:hypothetical protein n=1 Tax=Kordiimonas laminariae TaxID=2917717 RepID=UPI001FF693DF|nr:hypothetical protein [Kordiimonas laminariae]MCK0068159.1 hypothetical protein [Kordiimonas laminariae]
MIRVFGWNWQFAIFILLSFSLAHVARGDTIKESPVIFFTHGDTRMAQLQPDGTLKGPAYDLFTCSMEKMNQPFKVSIAPLSRANSLMTNHKNGVWFPSSMKTTDERDARMVGPAGDTNLYFFMLKDNPLKPGTRDFKRKARLTAYKGSAMERHLLKERYVYVEGSADVQRMISMLLSNRADALLAVDMRRVLPEETRKLVEENLRMELFRKMPIGFQIAKPTHLGHPGFTSAFRAALNSCKS